MSETSADRGLLQQFEAAVEGLEYGSESDAPFQVALWDEADLPSLTPAAVVQKTAHAQDTPTEEVSLERFFGEATQEQDWFGDEERATAQRYRDLVALINASLTDVHVFRLGHASMDVYVAGRTSSGQWLVLSTQVVET